MLARHRFLLTCAVRACDNVLVDEEPTRAARRPSNDGEDLMYKCLLVAALSVVGALSVPANAQTAANNTINAMALHAMPYEALGTYTSTPGETEVQFLERMRPVLRAFSDSTQFEACAEIASTADGKSWGILLGSSKSHLGCVVYPGRVPAGMAATGVTIHSHGGSKGFGMNRADRLLTGTPDMGRYVWIDAQRLDHFSPTDFAGGPGYLATPTGLLYQDGTPGSEQAVNAIATTATLASRSP